MTHSTPPALPCPTRIVLLLCAVCLGPLWSLRAQDAPGPAAPAADEVVRVAVSPFAPFCILDGDEPRGYAVDTWEAIAEESGLAYEYVRCTGVTDKLDALRNGRADIGIGGISATSAREADVDFTHATYNSGLDILVRTGAGGATMAVLQAMFSGTNLKVIIGFVLLIVITGHLIWLAERGKDSFNDHYVKGVFEGMYWAVVTASTVGYGDKVPGKFTGRLLAALVIIVSLPIFGYFVAALSSAMTVETISASIQGPEDLPGKRVAVIKGTTGDTWARENNLIPQAYDSGEDACRALIRGNVDAVVYDLPYLRYYANRNADADVMVVGKTFCKQPIAFALPESSPLREQVDQALLQQEEAGAMARWRKKWFGE